MQYVYLAIGTSPIWVVVIYIVFRKTAPLFHTKKTYVHTYINKHEISDQEYTILENEFDFFKRLNLKYKASFEHQVALFLKENKFVGKENLEITDQMRILIAASNVMLTFGMRHFENYSFDLIEIHPTAYYSPFSKGYHLGEFNATRKKIVFAWDSFLEGYEYSNSNRNLAIHEFTHAMHVYAKKRNETSSVTFVETFDKIMDYVYEADTLHHIKEVGYFREYAYTNQYEFLAVLLEHFFETPNEFKSHFPKLYAMIIKMLNYDESVFTSINH